jgi:hypothetical protein
MVCYKIIRRPPHISSISPIRVQVLIVVEVVAAIDKNNNKIYNKVIKAENIGN